MIIEWLPAAERDFTAIIDFIAEDNPQAAIHRVTKSKPKSPDWVSMVSVGEPGASRGPGSW